MDRGIDERDTYIFMEMGKGRFITVCVCVEGESRRKGVVCKVGLRGGIEGDGLVRRRR